MRDILDFIGFVATVAALTAGMYGFIVFMACLD